MTIPLTQKYGHTLNTHFRYLICLLDRGHIKLGCQKTFNLTGVMDMVKVRLDDEIPMGYGFVSVVGVDIFVIEVPQSDKKIWLDGKYFVYENNDVVEKVVNQNDEPMTLFISYTECDTTIVDIIEEKIKERLKDRIKISRYIQLQYKDSFKAFMNTIQDHDFVLTVVSDTYLKRQACMYEVGEIIKDRHYKDRLLFVVLSEKERKYYGEAVSKASEDLKIMGQIFRKDMSEFLDFLSDENGRSFEKLYVNNFDEVIAWLK